jgi:hypothetical protein
VAVNQGGPRAACGGQRRKEDKYTLEVALDQPCKFHSSPSRLAMHTMRQCNFIKELEQHTHQLPGPPPDQPAEGQEDREARAGSSGRLG